MLQLTGFEIIVVKWPKFSPKILHLRDPPRALLPRGVDLTRTDVYHCAEFHADRCHCRRDICNRSETNSKLSTLPY